MEKPIPSDKQIKMFYKNRLMFLQTILMEQIKTINLEIDMISDIIKRTKDDE
ncbi:MAG: hypothetical protein [Microvirus sp.]|nr:MAG: hypothetical protein [Microvirus sp.]